MKLCDVPEGTRVRIVLEGVYRDARTPYGYRRMLHADNMPEPMKVPFGAYVADRLEVEVLSPAWQGGDVVAYAGATFVRTSGVDGLWLGSNGWKASDDEINARHELGQVKHVLRDGEAI